jgi:menaquinol-cytochrome c reductase iron-sulfur subunit
MNRRTVLKWISRSLGAVTAAVVGIPAVQYVRGTLQQAQEPVSVYRRVARLRDLQPGRPLQVPVLGQRRDAWTVEANQVIGRVWLVRVESSAPTDERVATPQIVAFTSVCPHMGCQVQLKGEGTSFVCPCHRAAFGLDGSRIQDAKTGEPNHAPRGLDSLDCRIVQDARTGESWVEVLFQKFEPGLTHKVPT